MAQESKVTKEWKEAEMRALSPKTMELSQPDVLQPKLGHLPPIDEMEYKEAYENCQQISSKFSKQIIWEILSYIRPDPDLEKVFKIYFIMKGCPAPTWSRVRDFLANPVF